MLLQTAEINAIWGKIWTLGVEKCNFQRYNKCGIDPTNFTQVDLDSLQGKMNE